MVRDKFLSIRRVGLPMVAAVFAMASNIAMAGAVSSFDSGSEGWSIVSFSDLALGSYGVVGTYASTYNASGGNTGGYVSSTDPDGGDFTFSAPAAFLGNQSASYNDTLSYDAFHIGALSYNASDVILTGGGLRLLWQSSPALALTSAWSNVSVLLAPSAQWRVGSPGGALASVADFQTVLGSLTGLYIRGEYTSGSETAGLDNVHLNGSAVPEPDSIVLLLGGLIAGAAQWRGKRKIC